MLFGILLASLSRLADLLPNRLPLIVLVFLDRVEESMALPQVNVKKTSMYLRQPQKHRNGRRRTSSSANSA